MTDVNVNENDIAAIEKKIAEDAKTKEDAIKSEVEKKVKSEIAQKQRMKEFEDKLKALEEEKVKMQEDKSKYEETLKNQETQHQEEVKALKEKIGSSKQIYSPNQGNQKPANPFNNINESNYDDIESESKAKFFEYTKLDRTK